MSSLYLLCKYKMALYFGTTPVEPNAILNPITTVKPISYVPTSEQEFLPLLLLLVNTTTDTLQWLYNDAIEQELVPYIPPIQPARYTFHVFTSNNSLPDQIITHPFAQSHTISQFGTRLLSISFYVQALKLNDIPDVARVIASNLTIAEIDLLCASDPRLNQLICQSDPFYRQLLRTKIGTIPKGRPSKFNVPLDTVIAALSIDQIKLFLRYYETIGASQDIITKRNLFTLLTYLAFPVEYEAAHTSPFNRNPANRFLDKIVPDNQSNEPLNPSAIPLVFELYLLLPTVDLRIYFIKTHVKGLVQSPHFIDFLNVLDTNSRIYLLTSLLWTRGRPLITPELKEQLLARLGLTEEQAKQELLG